MRIAALLLLLGIALSCDGGGPTATLSPEATATPGATISPTPTPSPTPPAAAADEPPERDLIDLAQRFRGLPADTSRQARQSPHAYQVGDTEQFTIIDVDTPSARMATASLRLVTEHGYFFVEQGVAVDDSTLNTIGADFETLVYPRVTAAFGQEWSPGVDADARISIVHAGLSGAGCYFSSSDEYPQRVVPRSNEREAVYLDASYLNSPGAAYNALLAL